MTYSLTYSLTGVRCRATSVAKKYQLPVDTVKHEKWLNLSFSVPVSQLGIKISDGDASTSEQLNCNPIHNTDLYRPPPAVME